MLSEIPIDNEQLIFVDESDKFKEIYRNSPPSTSKQDVKLRRVIFSEEYEMDDDMTAEGRFGEVYRCVCRRTNQERAAKWVTAKTRKERESIKQEIRILAMMQHPNIVQIFDAIDTGPLRDDLVIITEMMHGGELFDRIADRHYILTETAIAMIMGQVCEALRYVHSKNIIHLDVKPENIVFDTQHGNRIKLIDFGLAQEWDGKTELQIIAGTAEFIAPEVINFDAIDYRTDMWSVGVITYILLSGISPFLGDNDADTYVNVTKGVWRFDETAFEQVSTRAKDFVKKLLCFRKEERLTAEDALHHQFLSWSKRRSAGPSLQKRRLLSYVYRRRWKRAVNALLACNRLLNSVANTPATSTDGTDSDGSK